MIGQTMIVTEGMDEGREVVVLSIEDGVLYCESLDGDTLESGGNVLTEFGFDEDRLESADPNRKFKGMHIVVLDKTEEGKKNINKIALAGMKGVITKLNDKRSQVTLENGEVTLLGNNLMVRDESYIPPKPIDIKRNSLVVFSREGEKNTLGIVTSKSSKKCSVSFRNVDFDDTITIDRFNVLRVITGKDISKHIQTRVDMKTINELTQRLQTLKNMKKELFQKFDVETALEFSYNINEQMDDIKIELDNIKPVKVFRGTNIEVNKDDKLSKQFLKYLAAKKETQDTQEFMGVRVKKLGGVYLEPNQISKFKHINKYDVVNTPKKPQTKDEYVGVEIECLVDVSRDELNELLIKNNLYKQCKLVSDSSIRKDDKSNNKNDIEITFMSKKSNYKVGLKKLTDLIESIGGYVNSSCGLHVHFDVRNKDAKTVYNRLFKTQDLLMKMVNKDRRDHQYCRPSSENFELQVRNSQKYSHINVATIKKHGTIEVRLHQGSCNFDEISNWIDLLHTIIDNKGYVSARSNVHTIVRQLKLSSKQKRYVLDTVRKQA